jgi:hypothetical protein
VKPYRRAAHNQTPTQLDLDEKPKADSGRDPGRLAALASFSRTQLAIGDASCQRWALLGALRGWSGI